MNTLTRLNGLQKDFIRTTLEYIADYTDFENFSVEGVLALRIMCMGKDDKKLPHLVNQYIKKVIKELREEKEAINE
jgi:hypothetical protein